MRRGDGENKTGERRRRILGERPFRLGRRLQRLRFVDLDVGHGNFPSAEASAEPVAADFADQGSESRLASGVTLLQAQALGRPPGPYASQIGIGADEL